MDFQLSEEQKMFQSMVRDFAQTEIKPIAAKIDQDEKIPPELFKKMGEIGLLGIAIDEKYGGSGGDYVSQAIACEEISRASGSVGTFFLAHLSLATNPIVKFGNEEQKKKYLPGIAQGTIINCFGLTETNAGSDAGALQTTATPKGDTFVLNGNKIFITNGAEANLCVLFATTDKAVGYKGICAFIVEKDTPGFSVGKLEHKLGIRGSSTAELIFDNCVIPASNMVGDKGKGLKVALEAIDASRVTVAAQSVGIAQAAYDDALAYAKDRKQFDSPLTGFQAIQWMLADMATSIEASRLLVYRASWLKDAGQPFTKEACMAKVFAAECSRLVCNHAVQIHGGYGYCRDYSVERYLRDAKITEIYEGTSEMQRMTIARQLIKD